VRSGNLTISPLTIDAQLYPDSRVDHFKSLLVRIVGIFWEMGEGEDKG